MPESTLKVALTGNPNSGKTTLFNALTGLNQKVGNFPGVTVEKKTGTIKFSGSKNLQITDLPGTYSLYPKSLDEVVTYRVLIDSSNPDYPDVTVVVADATNLKRSLFLCTQLIDLGKPVVLALNMIDLLEKQGISINSEVLSMELGIPVISINARQKIGLESLTEVLSQSSQKPQKEFTRLEAYSHDIIFKIKQEFNLSSDYEAFHLANTSKEEYSFRNPLGLNGQWQAKKYQAEETLYRYNRISELLEKVLTQVKPFKVSFSERLDKILTHRIFGFIIFIGILFMVFQAVFSWAKYPADFLDQSIQDLSLWLKTVLPTSWLTSLLTDGIIAGIGGIIVFIPQIALLFFFIGLLEDTGYMARVSFIMDRMMRKLGLNGKSVIPLISGVACAVPAIMAARTIQNKKERLITIMVTPLMSCSARIPVFTLLISLVIPSKHIGFVNLQGLSLMLLYIIGSLAAIASAFVFKLFVQSRERSYFIMEMPIYRVPRWQSIFVTIFQKVKIFLFDAGKIIILISIVLWFLASFAPGNSFRRIDEKYGKLVLVNEKAVKHDQETEAKIRSERLEASYAGHLGKVIEPIIKPLGFDWKIGISLITSFAAREVFVGTMATIYSSSSDESDNSTIRQKMLSDKNPETGLPVFTLATGLSLMIFYAFAMQCMSTVSVVYRETKSLKWPLIQIAYMSCLAYFASLITYKLFA